MATGHITNIDQVNFALKYVTKICTAVTESCLILISTDLFYSVMDFVHQEANCSWTAERQLQGKDLP